jgi:hypothetical protein
MQEYTNNSSSIANFYSTEWDLWADQFYIQLVYKPHWLFSQAMGEKKTLSISDTLGKEISGIFQPYSYFIGSTALQF